MISLEEIRQAKIYGVRPKRTFRQAAMKYLEENQHKASIWVDAIQLKILDEYIGNLPLESIHMSSLKEYIKGRTRKEVKRKKPKKTKIVKKLKKRTINYGLQVVRRILNLAEQEWKDEYGLSWLIKAPKLN